MATDYRRVKGSPGPIRWPAVVQLSCGLRLTRTICRSVFDGGVTWFFDADGNCFTRQGRYLVQCDEPAGLVEPPEIEAGAV